MTSWYLGVIVPAVLPFPVLQWKVSSICFFSFSFSPLSAQKMKAQFGTTWEAEQGLNFLNTASIRNSDLMRAFFWIGMGNSFPCSTRSFSRKQRKNVYIKFLEEKKCSLVQSGKSPGLSSFGSRSQRPLLHLLAEKLPFLVHCLLFQISSLFQYRTDVMIKYL